MNGIELFPDRKAFRTWLSAHASSSAGVWLLFGKAGGPKTLKASEALEEALCFGWIDGRMQRIDANSYKKYFSRRRTESKWSLRNKALAEKLEKLGMMTEQGRRKMEEAKKNGRWDTPAPTEITERHIASLAALLKGHEPASMNFQAMPLSVRRTYTRAYLAAKTDAGRAKRLAWIIERLGRNLRPM